MRQRSLLLLAFLLLCGTLLLGTEVSRAQNTDPLESFYAVTNFFSDYLPGWYEEILEVTPQGNDVRVRVIRISAANPYCGGDLVRAADRVLPDTTMQEVAGKVDLCSYSDQSVTAALKAAAPKAVEGNEDSATMSIVAMCGGKEKVFDFPYPSEVDQNVLRRDNPRVTRLWHLTWEVRSQAFGEHFSFRDLPAAQEKEAEDLGTEFLPELVSGKFDSAFAGATCGGEKCDTNYLAWLLRGYTGPRANKDPSSVELTNALRLHLSKYDLPKYSPLAKQARIQGEVRLAIIPDASTGLVKDVQLVSGSPMLGNSAVDAARQWQFSPGSQSGQPVEAILKFAICTDE
jgi:TonB family protein